MPGVYEVMQQSFEKQCENEIAIRSHLDAETQLDQASRVMSCWRRHAVCVMAAMFLCFRISLLVLSH